MPFSWADSSQFISQQIYLGHQSPDPAHGMNQFRYPVQNVRVQMGRTFRENRKMSMVAKIDSFIEELQFGEHNFNLNA